tara:strand:- start:1990 stop:3654 length:1665 start_codon:yes stop_codon:yes gene_type:complete
MTSQTMLTEVEHTDASGTVTDITSYVVNYKVTQTYGDSMETAEIAFQSGIASAVTIANGDRLTVKRGFTTATDDFVFDGILIETETEGGFLVFKCKDRLYETIKAEVTKSYDKDIDPEAGVISEIFKDLINTYTPLLADSSSVTPTTGAGYPVLDKFVMRNDEVFTGITQLAEYVNFTILYNPTTQKVEFKPKGSVTSSTTLEVGTNVTNIPKWIEDMTEMVNKVTVFGASQIDTRIELFSGDGADDEFYVASKPIDTNVSIGGTEQVRGVVGSSGSYDFTADEDLKKFTFVTPPVLGVNNISIQYTTSIPVPVTASNTVSIATYGGPDQTPTEKTFYEKNIITVDDAIERATSILNKYSTPFLETEMVVQNAITFEPGELVLCNDTVNNILNKHLIIAKIEMNYPYAGDKLIVGDKILRVEDWDVDLAKRVKDIQAELSKNIDLLIHVISLDKQIKFKRALLTIQRRNIAGISGIYGSATQGIYGQAYYGSSGMIWGNSVLGIWNQVDWGDPFTSFVLGHATGAILGTSELGEDNPLPWQTLYTKVYGATEGY